MKRKFKAIEIEELKSLILKKVDADKSDQKKIRQKIRNIGFRISDFSSKKGFNIEDFEQLIELGEIEVMDTLKVAVQKNVLDESKVQNPNSRVKDFDCFYHFDELPNEIINHFGFYCIRLKKDSLVPERYMKYIRERNNRVLYVGKAEKQTLKERLDQEILHKSPGTFFRSIGVALGYWPDKGSLKGKKNTKNYRFNKENTNRIIQWLKVNTEISIRVFSGDFNKIERELILYQLPLLNDKQNPKKISELIEDRKVARQIALSENA